MSKIVSTRITPDRVYIVISFDCKHEETVNLWSLPENQAQAVRAESLTWAGTERPCQTCNDRRAEILRSWMIDS